MPRSRCLTEVIILVTPVDYESAFLEQLEVIEDAVRFIARRYHLRPAELEELSADVRVKIIDNDYEVLRKFQGRSTLKSYLITVVHRHFLSGRVAAWGKWRPCIQARRLGPVAVKLDRLLTRDGMTFDEAARLLQINEGVALGEPELRAMGERFPARNRRTLVGDDHLAGVSDDQPGPHALYERAANLAAAERIDAALGAALQRLPAVDRLILRLCFFERMTIADVARLLQREQKPLYGHVARIITQLRRDLESYGVDQATARNVIGDAEFELQPAFSERAE